MQDALLEKDGWGHSIALVGIDLANHAGVKQLILFHHEPTCNDQALIQLVETAQIYRMQVQPRPEFEILLACEGLELQV